MWRMLTRELSPRDVLLTDAERLCVYTERGAVLDGVALSDEEIATATVVANLDDYDEINARGLNEADTNLPSLLVFTRRGRVTSAWRRRD